MIIPLIMSKFDIVCLSRLYFLPPPSDSLSSSPFLFAIQFFSQSIRFRFQTKRSLIFMSILQIFYTFYVMFSNVANIKRLRFRILICCLLAYICNKSFSYPTVIYPYLTKMAVMITMISDVTFAVAEARIVLLRSLRVDTSKVTMPNTNEETNGCQLEGFTNEWNWNKLEAITTLIDWGQLSFLFYINYWHVLIVWMVEIVSICFKD